MVEFSTILQFIQATGIIVGVAYYILNIENNRRNQDLQLETRQTQLFMQIYMRYIESDLFSENLFKLFAREWTNFDDYVEKYGFAGLKGNQPDGGDLNKMMTFYEGISVLLKRQMIDISLVYELMPTNVTALWGKYESLIKEIRTMDGAPPSLFILVEELAIQGDQVLIQYSKTSEWRPKG